MSRLNRLCSIALLLAESAGIAPATERGWALVKADVVVSGQLELSSYFLSFDGIHVNGTIIPTEVLLGNTQVGKALPFHYLVPCSLIDALPFPNRAIHCDYRFAWKNWSIGKAFFTEPGIWALRRMPDSRWTSAIEAEDSLYRGQSGRDFVTKRLAYMKEHPLPGRLKHPELLK